MHPEQSILRVRAFFFFFFFFSYHSWSLPCLLQLQTWLHALDYRCFGILKYWNHLINMLVSNIFLSCRNIFQNGIEAKSKKSWRLFVKKLKSLCSSNHPTVFKFCWNVEKHYKGITNDISDSWCQHLQRQYERSYRNINFLH